MFCKSLTVTEFTVFWEVFFWNSLAIHHIIWTAQHNIVTLEHLDRWFPLWTANKLWWVLRLNPLKPILIIWLKHFFFPGGHVGKVLNKANWGPCSTLQILSLYWQHKSKRISIYFLKGILAVIYTLNSVYKLSREKETGRIVDPSEEILIFNSL